MIRKLGLSLGALLVTAACTDSSQHTVTVPQKPATAIKTPDPNTNNSQHSTVPSVPTTPNGDQAPTQPQATSTPAPAPVAPVVPSTPTTPVNPAPAPSSAPAPQPNTPNTPTVQPSAAPNSNTVPLGGGRVKLNDLTIDPPAGMGILQQAAVDGIAFVAYGDGASKYVVIYSRQQTGLTTTALFGNGAQVVQGEASKQVGNHTWKVIETSKSLRGGGSMAGTYYVTAFLMEQAGFSYYGYSRASSADQARANVMALLGTIQ